MHLIIRTPYQEESQFLLLPCRTQYQACTQELEIPYGYYSANDGEDMHNTVAWILKKYHLHTLLPQIQNQRLKRWQFEPHEDAWEIFYLLELPHPIIEDALFYTAEQFNNTIQYRLADYQRHCLNAINTNTDPNPLDLLTLIEHPNWLDTCIKHFLAILDQYPDKHPLCSYDLYRYIKQHLMSCSLIDQDRIAQLELIFQHYSTLEKILSQQALTKLFVLNAGNPSPYLCKYIPAFNLSQPHIAQALPTLSTQWARLHNTDNPPVQLAEDLSSLIAYYNRKLTLIEKAPWHHQESIKQHAILMQLIKIADALVNSKDSAHIKRDQLALCLEHPCQNLRYARISNAVRIVLMEHFTAQLQANTQVSIQMTMAFLQKLGEKPTATDIRHLLNNEKRLDL